MKPARTLVIHADGECVSAIEQSLQRLGCDVLTCNAIEAVAVVTEHKPRFVILAPSLPPVERQTLPVLLKKLRSEVSVFVLDKPEMLPYALAAATGHS